MSSGWSDEHWREIAQDCEDDLLNKRLDKAFKFLKYTRKYHEYKRRDGSIEIKSNTKNVIY